MKNRDKKKKITQKEIDAFHKDLKTLFALKILTGEMSEKEIAGAKKALKALKII